MGELTWPGKFFQETEDKKVFVWSSMIGGLAMHSFGEKAIELFIKMIECGIEPSEITYINIFIFCIKEWCEFSPQLHLPPVI